LILVGLAVVIGLASIVTSGTQRIEVAESPNAPSATVEAEAVTSASTTIKVAPAADTQPSTGAGDFLENLALSSVVSIDIYSESELCGGGTGSAVLDGNFVLTNLHVVEDSETSDCNVDEIIVRYLEQVDELPVRGFTAEVIAIDEPADLAVLRLTRLQNITKQLTPVAIGVSVSVNEDLFIAGFPAIGGDSITFSRGIVSGFLQDGGIRWIKTDAQISGGNSGGPAFNSRGELVGVPTKASASSGGEIVDCRIVEDTNGDGQINDRDSCVPIGGSFSLLSPALSVKKILEKASG
jgi:S1-C subfamily serine protease